MTGTKMVKIWDDGAVYKADGSDKAVRVLYGFAMGSDVGCHHPTGHYAVADLGTWDGTDFVEDVYTKCDAPSKAVIGWPKVYKGYDGTGDDFDAWEADAVVILLK